MKWKLLLGEAQAEPQGDVATAWGAAATTWWAAIPVNIDPATATEHTVSTTAGTGWMITRTAAIIVVS